MGGQTRPNGDGPCGVISLCRPLTSSGCKAEFSRIVSPYFDFLHAAKFSHPSTMYSASGNMSTDVSVSPLPSSLKRRSKRTARCRDPKVWTPSRLKGLTNTSRSQKTMTDFGLVLHPLCTIPITIRSHTHFPDPKANVQIVILAWSALRNILWQDLWLITACVG